MKKLLDPAQIKRLFIDHGEKIAFGFFSLVVIGALATTSWFGYKRTPEELSALSEEALKGLDISDWPQEERASFVNSTYKDRAVALITSKIQDGLYAYSTNFSDPLYPRRLPAEEPSYPTVQHLIATSGVVPLALVASTKESEIASNEEEKSKEPKETTEAPMENEDLGVASEDAPAEKGKGKDNKPQLAGTPVPEGDLIPQAGQVKGPSVDEMYKGAMSGNKKTKGKAAEEKELMQLVSFERVVGRRYVSVRGVFDMKQAAELYARALHLDRSQRAIDRVLIEDFVLERQRLVPGPDPWSGGWETVSKDFAYELLDEAAGMAIDPVSPLARHERLTMPLPDRVTGRWGSRATHPMLKDLELSDEQSKAEEQIADAIVDEYESTLGGSEKKDKKKKGFQGYQRDTGRAARTVFSGAGQQGGGGARSARGGSQGMEKMFEKMKQGMSGGQAMSSKNMGPRGRMMDPAAMMMGSGFNNEMDNIRQRYTAANKLLFRYIDFDVEPGETYRYRVRVIFENPNFEADPEELSDPALAEGATRESPFSDPTTPVTVEDDTKVFLVQVDHRPGRTYGFADFSIVQWSTDFGTSMADRVVNSFGQMVGGEDKTKILDLATPAIRDEAVTFRSRDILVDSYVSPYLDLSEHADLNLEPVKRSGLQSVGVSDEVLVVDRYGDLLTLAVTEQASARKTAESWVALERKPYAEALAAQEDSGGGEAGSEMMMPDFGGALPGRGSKKK